MARVSVEIRDHVAHVTLTRGDKMNALNSQMVEAIIAAAADVAASEARAVVLAGEGASFCAGLDLASFASLAQRDTETWLMERSHGTSNEMQAVAMVWHELEIPVIAALQGAVFGGGLQLALGADIRIGAPDSKLALMEMKWGILPDMGAMALLPRLVRSDVLRRMTYTGTPVSADQALQWGLLSEISETPLEAAQALAQQIAQQGPNAIRAAKRLIAFAESGASQAEVLLQESREQIALIGKAEQMEVVAARMQKRAPKFD